MPAALRHDALSEAAIVFALAMICYTANGKTIPSGDALPARYLPFAILQRGSFYLDEFPFLYAGADAYWAQKVGDHYVSLYPVGAAVLAVPFYAPAVLWTGTTPGQARGPELEKLAASGMVALSVAFLYAALRTLASRRWALAIVVAYGLGTSSLSVSSQALWQHGPAQLCLAIGIFLFVCGREMPFFTMLAGLPLAFAVVCRPTNVTMFVAAAGYVLLVQPRTILGFALAAAPAIGFQIWYNAVCLGSPFAYQFPIWRGPYWNDSVRTNLAGLLLSPTRGLLVYSPVLAFSLWGAAVAWGRDGDRLARALGVGVLLTLVLHSRWGMYWGGACYGPRLLADVTPALAFLLVPCGRLFSRLAIARALFALTLAWSVAAHAAGAYWDDGSWNKKLDSLARHPEILWSWSDNQLVNAFRGASLALVPRSMRSPTAVDPLVEARLEDQVEADPRHDQALLALRELYESGDDRARAQVVEALRRERFTPRHRLEWKLGDELTLRGVDWTVPDRATLEITSYWRAERTIAEDYAAYTRWIGEGCDGNDDDVLGAGTHPTTHWIAGETFKQTRRLTLPARIAPAGCSLQLGVWSPREGRKLDIRGWPLWRRTGTVLIVKLGPDGAASVSAADR
jgi:hypothetical protein